MQKPLIGLLTNTLTQVEDCDAEKLSISSRYVMALEEVVDAHCVALLFKNKLDMDILDRIDGIMLTGGFANVNPKFYNGTYELKSGENDPLRDRTAWAVLQRTMAIGLPILGICRGLQEINVYHGGTLKGDVHLQQDTFEHIAKFEDGRYNFEPRQHVKIMPNSMLSDWLDGAKTTYINSAHGQAIDTLGDGLAVEAVCVDDNIIEAVRIINHPNFGYAVQWHPESRTCRQEKVNQMLLKAFGDACRTYRK